MSKPVNNPGAAAHPEGAKPTKPATSILAFTQMVGMTEAQKGDLQAFTKQHGCSPSATVGAALAMYYESIGAGVAQPPAGAKAAKAVAVKVPAGPHALSALATMLAKRLDAFPKPRKKVVIGRSPRTTSTVGVSMPIPLIRRLRAFAGRKNCTLAAVVVVALEHFLDMYSA